MEATTQAKPVEVDSNTVQVMKGSRTLLSVNAPAVDTKYLMPHGYTVYASYERPVPAKAILCPHSQQQLFTSRNGHARCSIAKRADVTLELNTSRPLFLHSILEDTSPIEDAAFDKLLQLVMSGTTIVLSGSILSTKLSVICKKVEAFSTVWGVLKLALGRSEDLSTLVKFEWSKLNPDVDLTTLPICGEVKVSGEFETRPVGFLVMGLASDEVLIYRPEPEEVYLACPDDETIKMVKESYPDAKWYLGNPQPDNDPDDYLDDLLGVLDLNDYSDPLNLGGYGQPGSKYTDFDSVLTSMTGGGYFNHDPLSGIGKGLFSQDSLYSSELGGRRRRQSLFDNI